MNVFLNFFYYVLIYVFLNKWYIIVDLIVRLTNRPIVKAIGIEATSYKLQASSFLMIFQKMILRIEKIFFEL